MAKFTCPFCIREYDLKEVLYVCPDCLNPSERGFFEKEPVKCKNQIEDFNGNKRPCGGFATKRICKYCGQSIPKTALETPNLPFSIVGVSNSGKTNYITVMLEELAHSSGLRLALGHQTPETYTHQEENRKRIYDEHSFPDSTNRDEAKIPSIWYIRNLAKKHNNICPTYTFTIFDGAGESHESLDPDSTECRYINASKAILLTVDPLILPGVVKKGGVDSEVMNNSLAGDRLANASSTAIVNNVANYIKSARGIRANKVLDIPVAVVLTKFDTILNHRAFGPQALIKNSSLTVRNGMVDMAEIQQVDSEIRNWLEQIGESAFIDALDSHFKEYYFFGVSSYGAPPKDAYTLPDDIKPHRVLDPIFWLFKRAKFID